MGMAHRSRHKMEDQLDHGKEHKRKRMLADYEAASYRASEGAALNQGLGHVPQRYLELENEHEKGWGDRLMLYTGVTYLTGTAAGGLYGAFTGLSGQPKAKNLRLRTNMLLNSTGKYGGKIGNGLASFGTSSSHP